MMIWKKEEGITKDDIKNNLLKKDISLNDSEIDQIVNMIKFKDNSSDKIS
jgi:hypothetical protein